MNHFIRYNCNDIDGCPFWFRPIVRNGAAFEMFDCVVKFYRSNDDEFIFWVDSKYSATEAKEIIDRVSKILSYVFMAPIYQRDVATYKTEQTLEINSLLGKQKQEKISFIESTITSFDKTREFFYEILDLLNVGIENIYKGRYEDSFVYFFKVVERIAKQYYVLYMRKHHTKAFTKKAKKELRDFIEQYALDNFNIELTEDILSSKVDLLYKDIKTDLYGSTYSKISLFITKNNLSFDVKAVSKIVKLRNKIAHGDSFDVSILNSNLFLCENLALEMVSKHFFRKTYKDLGMELRIEEF